MIMDIENLLTPRFKIIADFPGNTFDINDLITDLNAIQITELEEYPHLFKKLLWFEDRQLNEMPKFLKHTLSGKTTYHKVNNWDLSNPNFIEWKCEEDFGNFGMWLKDFNYMPCTEAEYLANKA
jgi:hypothetical protein